MIKRIPVKFLTVGMYISDLNAEWIPHSNLKKKGLIKNALVIGKIKQLGITEIYIDTSIGKIRLPDTILHKPGKLTAEEFDIIKQLARFSRDILQQTKGMRALAVTVAAQHHEKVDGSGYPEGLSLDEISPFGRMVAIADRL